MKVSHKNVKSNPKKLSRSLYVPADVWHALRVYLISHRLGSANEYILEATIDRMKRDGIKVAA